MDDHRQRVHRLAGQQDVELDHVRRPQAQEVVVQRGVAAGARLQLVEEVEHDLGQRQVVGDLDALGRQPVHAVVHAPALLAELHDRPHELLGREDRRPDVGLAHLLHGGGVGEVRGVVDGDGLPVAEQDLELHAGHRRQQLQVVLALQALAHDVHVQQAQEAAAEAEAQGP